MASKIFPMFNLVLHDNLCQRPNVLFYFWEEKLFCCCVDLVIESIYKYICRYMSLIFFVLAQEYIISIFLLSVIFSFHLLQFVTQRAFSSYTACNWITVMPSLVEVSLSRTQMLHRHVVVVNLLLLRCRIYHVFIIYRDNLTELKRMKFIWMYKIRVLYFIKQVSYHTCFLKWMDMLMEQDVNVKKEFNVIKVQYWFGSHSTVSWLH